MADFLTCNWSGGEPKLIPASSQCSLVWGHNAQIVNDKRRIELLLLTKTFTKELKALAHKCCSLFCLFRVHNLGNRWTQLNNSNSIWFHLRWLLSQNFMDIHVAKFIDREYFRLRSCCSQRETHFHCTRIKINGGVHAYKGIFSLKMINNMIIWYDFYGYHFCLWMMRCEMGLVMLRLFARAIVQGILKFTTLSLDCFVY